jgi:hypothetical protein
MATMRDGKAISGLICAGFLAIVLTGCESPSWTHTLNESFNAKDKDKDESSKPLTAEEHRRE